MPLTGKCVALTGGLEGMTRSEFKRLVAEANGTYAATLDERVHILLVGDNPLASRVEQARKLGAEVLDREAFDRLLARSQQPDVPLAFEAPVEAPPAVVVSADRVRIVDLALPRRPAGPLTPQLDLFEHYTLDRPTVEMLRFLACAARLRQPCLLEGDTATSKTSAILYLAALTGQQVVRINLNGQTDTSELVGRYVPNDEEIRLPVDELLAHLHLLEDESRQILERARAESRALTGVERQQIAANERIQSPQWRFQEGLVPRAMRMGWWVILDEVNLAEPQVLERLNPVLERDPTLVLTEGPGTRFGPGGDVPVHPDFRIFGTMNPAEYQSRSVLSPAYRDRWVATWQARAPGEVEYRQMLERVIFGRQPDVELGGLLYAGDQGLPAPYEALAEVDGVGEFLSRLSALHTGLVRMATPSDGKPAALGVTRRERYVFSRRALLAVLDGLTLTVCDPTGRELGFSDAPDRVAADAIERVYLERVRGDEDRQKVVQLLRSLGLSRSGWLHPFAEEASSEVTA